MNIKYIMHLVISVCVAVSFFFIDLGGYSVLIKLLIFYQILLLAFMIPYFSCKSLDSTVDENIKYERIIMKDSRMSEDPGRIIFDMVYIILYLVVVATFMIQPAEIWILMIIVIIFFRVVCENFAPDFKIEKKKQIIKTQIIFYLNFCFIFEFFKPAAYSFVALLFIIAFIFSAKKTCKNETMRMAFLNIGTLLCIERATVVMLLLCLLSLIWYNILGPKIIETIVKNKTPKNFNFYCFLINSYCNIVILRSKWWGKILYNVILFSLLLLFNYLNPWINFFIINFYFSYLMVSKAVYCNLLTDKGLIIEITKQMDFLCLEEMLLSVYTILKKESTFDDFMEENILVIFDYFYKINIQVREYLIEKEDCDKEDLMVMTLIDILETVGPESPHKTELKKRFKFYNLRLFKAPENEIIFDNSFIPQSPFWFNKITSCFI